MDSVKTVSVKQPSAGRPIGLVLGVALVVVGFVIVANHTAGSTSVAYWLSRGPDNPCIILAQRCTKTCYGAPSRVREATIKSLIDNDLN